MIAAAALQKQITRDFAPIWGIDADVAAFEDLSDVPLGYWPVIISKDIHINAQGIHLNERTGQPFALVRFSENWTLTTSHECLEMLADPSGNRIQAGNSIIGGSRVAYLVEVCDPCEAVDFAYSVNGVLVSDFYTPNFFDPVKVSNVRYSFTGAITEPRQILDGGYLSWIEPENQRLCQMFSGQPEPKCHPLRNGVANLRRYSDDRSAEHRMEAMTRRGVPKKKNLLLTGTIPQVKDYPPTDKLDKALQANAETIRRLISEFPKLGADSGLASFPKGGGDTGLR
jgi:hypothetical protein